MNKKHLALAAALSVAFIVGCSKKPPPPPPPEPAPPAVTAPAPAPTPAPQVDTAAERRARIEARMGEVFQPIYFAFDQSALSEQGKTIAEGVARLLQEAPEMTVRIEGHADEQGTNEYNLALGERRALAVQQYLVSYGIAAGRISVISYGEEKPAVEGRDESAWSLNRRAEFAPTF